MPALILLNGPPGIGKSTLARRYVEQHPLALNLDIDRLRDLIGGWRQRAVPAGLLARDLALAAARTHLTARHDVVIPQYLGRIEFIEQLNALADETGADFHEIALLDSKANALERFAHRSETSQQTAHQDADLQLASQGGRVELAAMYDRLAAVIAARPRTRTVPTGADQVDAAYRGFLACLS